VILRGLVTSNFRNLDPAEIAFHANTNIVVGRNGQGKTNLLEAIYLDRKSTRLNSSHP